MARASKQSALRYPLNEILGTEANVRVLRELARHGGELAAPMLVVRTGLAQSSVREALISLEGWKVVEAIGSERARLFRFRHSHPLVSALEHAFEAEEARFNAILGAIRDAAVGCGDSISAVWIYGSVARGQDSARSDVDIVVVAEPGMVPQIEETMFERLRSAEDRLAFVASLVAIDTHDLLRLASENDPWWADVARDSIPIIGERPEALEARLRPVRSREHRKAS